MCYVLCATARIRYVVKRFGVCLASAGHVNPDSSVACHACLKPPCVLFKLQGFYQKVLVQLGSVFPSTSAVYFHCRCVIFERDGSDSMLC